MGCECFRQTKLLSELAVLILSTSRVEHLRLVSQRSHVVAELHQPLGLLAECECELTEVISVNTKQLAAQRKN